ncbi:CRAL-TRIO domain-containing protein C3H8.02 like [Verticillium longisporum]|nr:CRAL-TRIO domain-containing protein C3H8.02 like [Verticillium longisporum]
MTQTVEPGTLGHLTADEQSKLQEAWKLLLELSGFKGTSPKVFRERFWGSVRQHHPDAIVLRFLRARKWDVEKAVEMLIATIDWRYERRMDEEIKNFLAQYRSGKSYVRGSDLEGRPVYIVKARLHNPSLQSAAAMEAFVLHNVETISLMVKAPNDKTCFVFDLSGFGLRNMDFHVVQFLVQVFEARYPESLGLVLVHNAPFVFWGIWSVIKHWLDPVVASKITFTSGKTGLSKYIPPENLQKSYGGNDSWEYKYIEPVVGENERLNDEEKRSKIQAEHDDIICQFDKSTAEWGRHEAGSDEAKRIDGRRVEIARKMEVNYWKLDPYLRSRTHYHRAGVIDAGGKIDYRATKVM